MGLNVAIIGAGLSGLACAVELKRKGAEVTVFEKSSGVGGRIKTEKIDGFLLDHGFQVFLPSYELGSYFFNYQNLHLKAFLPGAKIFSDGKFSLISDPLRDPAQLVATLFSPIASLKDKLLTLKLVFAGGPSYSEVELADSALLFLQDYGFSKSYIEKFFVPFFSGVFLSRELSVSSHYFRYLFNKFSKAYASLPKEGMSQLPLQMAEEIGRDNIRLNEEVNLKNFDRTSFDHMVWAGKPDESTEYFSVTTHYFKTKSNTWAGKTLYLNGDSKGPVNHVACLTAVNPNYAPDSWHLYSVNVLEKAPLEAVENHLKEMFGADEMRSWELLKSFDIKEALPAAPHYGALSDQPSSELFRCGDYLESASIQGALTSGLKTARLILDGSNSKSLE